MEKLVEKNSLLVIILLCITSYLTAYSSPVRFFTDSDPKGSLLVSQAILEHGTIKLDQYSETFANYLYQIVEMNGHYYYFFPLGTSLISIPFVWMANLTGQDMSEPTTSHQAQLQNLISAITVAISCLLIFLISRCFVNYSLSLLTTAAFVFGSSIMSTLGTALWSHNFTLVIDLLILLILITARQNKISALKPILLGALLFFANLSRPTSVIFTLLVMIYVYWESRQSFIRLIISYSILIGFFVLFSWNEYGPVLPHYYQLATRNNPHFLKAIYGNLFSPARGLFVYHPFLIVIFLSIPPMVNKLWREAFFWLGLSWFILHLFFISRWPNWWGGYSFGSRLFTDALPAVLLLTLLVFKRIHDFDSKIPRRALISGTISFTLVAIFINTFQGMYNLNTAMWNPVTDIDWNPRYLFSWKFAQFMANPKMLESLQYDRALMGLKPYKLGDEILPNSKKAIFMGWHKSELEGGCRWSDLRSAELMFRINPKQYLVSGDLFMEIAIGEPSIQNIDVFVNDTQVGEIPGQADLTSPTYTFPVSKEALGLEAANSSNLLPVVIKFTIPITQPVQPNSLQLMNLCMLKIYPDH